VSDERATYAPARSAPLSESRHFTFVESQSRSDRSDYRLVLPFRPHSVGPGSTVQPGWQEPQGSYSEAMRNYLFLLIAASVAAIPASFSSGVAARSHCHPASVSD